MLRPTILTTVGRTLLIHLIGNNFVSFTADQSAEHETKHKLHEYKVLEDVSGTK